MKRVNTLINYITLLLVIVILIFGVLIFRKLNANQLRIERKINCVSSYFNMPNRTGNTTLSCE